MNCSQIDVRYLLHFAIPDVLKQLGYFKDSHWENEKLIHDFPCPTCGCKDKYQIYTAQNNDYICWNCNERGYRALLKYDEFDKIHYIKLIKKENPK